MPSFHLRFLSNSMVATVLFGLLGASARADENYFGYTYGSETLPRGHSEIYQWATLRTGKADGRYRAFDLQTEIEHGFTDRLQGSLYLNALGHDIQGVGGLTDRDGLRFNGVQGALKYSLLSPYKDALGLALYAEPGYQRHRGGSGVREDLYFFETKLIVQKNYLESSLVWATNLAAEFERKHDPAADGWAGELELQLSTGLSYRVAPGWFVGAEGLATSAFEHMHLDELGEYAVFIGPNLHYSNARGWFTVTVLSQVTGWPANSAGRNLANFEKLELRLKLGCDF